MFVPDHPWRTEPEPAILVTRRVDNWPSSRAGFISSSFARASTMVTLTGLYGILHAICWHSHFPSIAEQIVWRASAFVIAIDPLTVLLAFVASSSGGFFLHKAELAYKGLENRGKEVDWTRVGLSFPPVGLFAAFQRRRKTIHPDRSVYQSAKSSSRSLPDTKLDILVATSIVRQTQAYPKSTAERAITHRSACSIEKYFSFLHLKKTIYQSG